MRLLFSSVRHLANLPLSMRHPLLKDDAFLADVATVRRGFSPVAPHASLDLWWLGQSGFLAHWHGHFLLLDPYLSDSLTRKYANTDKPHVRMSERVIAPERLDFIDVVTSSHHHTDHLDAETLQPLSRVNPRLVIVCPEAHRATVRERSDLPDERIVGLDALVGPMFPSGLATRRSGQASPHGVTVGPWTFHAIPAAHEARDTDALGRHLYLGYAINAGPWTLYHSGDTVLYEGMIDVLRSFVIDVAVLPINGREPERRVAGNLSGREAARLAREVGARFVVPCHYDMFSFNTATPDEFVDECERIRQPCRVLELGERLSLASPT